MDATARAQTAMLAELAQLLSRARIRAWLRGGWALDFHLGRLSRPHADIDLVTWERHRARLARLLAAHGYRALPPPRNPEAQSDFQKQGQELGIVFLRRDRRGRVVTAGIPLWRWPQESLPSRKLQFAGLTLRTVVPRQLLWEKLSYKRATGRPLRQKDIESAALLREVISARARGRPRARAASPRATARRS